MLRIAVGGTFDPLHDGHKALLMKACELASNGGKLLIGLTSDKMSHNKNHSIIDYASRYNNIVSFIKHKGCISEIVMLDDSYGPTINEDFDIIVVSPETYPIALKINKIRSEKNMSKIKIVIVDYVFAEDGLPISSTRIKKGDIDEHGKILK